MCVFTTVVSETDQARTFRIQAFTAKKVDEMFSVHFGEWFARQKSSRLKQQSFGWWFYSFLFSPLFREDSHFDKHIFQRGWFNHQLVIHWVLATWPGQMLSVSVLPWMVFHGKSHCSCWMRWRWGIRQHIAPCWISVNFGFIHDIANILWLRFDVCV